ncbi:uncharacterized protein LOC125489282 isoform X3 [Plutella xylostella]|nr:uncharacterized protein LOC125489282 isoform X3 [Plutella xylostella]
MSEMERKRLIAIRGQCKASFTRIETYISKDPPTFTIEDLEVRKRILVENYNTFKDTALNLILLGETATEEEEIEDRFLAISASLDRYIKSQHPSASGDHPTQSYSARMPSLDIPIFDGKNISGYKPFIEMFTAVVHNDHRISNIERLCFLKKYLRGEPLQLIDSLPIVGKSYESALELLKKRYDNPALLINNHVGCLLDLPSIQRGTATQLRDLAAQIRQHVTALQNLGEPVDKWDAILSCILLRKIDTLTVRLFHSERDTTKVIEVEELLNYLDKRAASLEASPSVSEKSHKSSVNFATSTTEKASHQCIICCKNHKLFECPTFKGLSLQKRHEFVIKNKLCKICLRFHSQKCRYKFKCSVCHSSSHNSLIHFVEEMPTSAPRGNDGEQPQQTFYPEVQTHWTS